MREEEKGCLPARSIIIGTEVTIIYKIKKKKKKERFIKVNEARFKD